MIQIHSFRELGILGWLDHLTCGTSSQGTQVPLVRRPGDLRRRARRGLHQARSHWPSASSRTWWGGTSCSQPCSCFGADLPGPGCLRRHGRREFPWSAGSPPILITFLEIFVAFLQAFIFMFLTAVFISLMSHHDEDARPRARGTATTQPAGALHDPVTDPPTN